MQPTRRWRLPADEPTEFRTRHGNELDGRERSNSRSSRSGCVGDGALLFDIATTSKSDPRRQVVKNVIGARIVRLREDRRWTQDELAKRVGLHRTYVGAVERGERNLTVWSLTRIALVLDVEPGDLLPSLALLRRGRGG